MYPILRYPVTMHLVSYCALIGMGHKLPPTLNRQPLNEAEYELVDANRVAQVSTRSE